MIWTGYVWGGCSVSAGGVSFGGYDVFSTADVHSTGNVQISCDTATSYSILLGPGAGSFDQRTLISGDNTLDYNLYTDASRSVVWGDGSGITDVVTGSSSGETVDHGVYGRIPARQNVTAGTYGDTVTITLEF